MPFIIREDLQGNQCAGQPTVNAGHGAAYGAAVSGRGANQAPLARRPRSEAPAKDRKDRAARLEALGARPPGPQKAKAPQRQAATTPLRHEARSGPNCLRHAGPRQPQRNRSTAPARVPFAPHAARVAGAPVGCGQQAARRAAAVRRQRSGPTNLPSTAGAPFGKAASSSKTGSKISSTASSRKPVPPSLPSSSRTPRASA